MQKEIVGQHAVAATLEGAWLDLENLTRLRLTSEDSSHPIEAALTGEAEIGWLAAEPGPQSIWFSFYVPQAIHRVYLCFEASDARTHEFVLRWSNDRGLTYRDIVRQQFNFSASTHREEETYFPELEGVTDLKLEILPDVSHGPAVATLRRFRIA